METGLKERRFQQFRSHPQRQR